MKGRESTERTAGPLHSLVKLLRLSKANDGCGSPKMRTERPLKLRSYSQLWWGSMKGLTIRRLPPSLADCGWKALFKISENWTITQVSITIPLKQIKQWKFSNHDELSLYMWLPILEFPVTSPQPPPVCHAESTSLHVVCGRRWRPAKHEVHVSELSVTVTNYRRQSI